VLRALLTDVDGTITDQGRSLHTGAIKEIRELVSRGVVVVLASGNTACFMDALCRMIGTSGTFIGENGGVYRIGFPGELHIHGDQPVCLEAFQILQKHYRDAGTPLQLLSPQYRYADVAFSRTVPPEEVEKLLADYDVQVIDTGFAIHLQAKGVNKATAFMDLANDLGIPPGEFLAIGDAINDVEMLKAAGIGVTLANGHLGAKAVAGYIAKNRYGDGFIEAMQKYSSHFLER
jgi:phosphoglycolate phosphatase (TIGR01487 family)